jgi:hypothetical protein
MHGTDSFDITLENTPYRHSPDRPVWTLINKLADHFGELSSKTEDSESVALLDALSLVLGGVHVAALRECCTNTLVGADATNDKMEFWAVPARCE